MSEPTNTPVVTIEQVTDLINTTVSGAMARSQKEFSKLLTPVTEQLTGFQSTLETFRTPPTTNQDGTPAIQPDPKFAVMEKEIRDLKLGREGDQAKAAKLERENALGKALGAYTFASDASRDTAFKVFSSDIQVTSDGQFVIGDEPLEAAVKGRMAQLPGLLAPKAVGGSGATSGSGVQFGSNDIKPGMSMDQYRTIFDNIQKQRTT